MNLRSKENPFFTPRERIKVGGGVAFLAFIASLTAIEQLAEPFNLENPLDRLALGFAAICALIGIGVAGSGLGSASKRRKERLNGA